MLSIRKGGHADLEKYYPLMEMDFESDLAEFTSKTSGKTEQLKPIELEIDFSVEYTTPVDQIVVKKRSKSMKKEKKEVEPKNENSIFKEIAEDVEDVHEMMRQQEEYVESPRDESPSFMNQEIVDGELIDLS